uniref:Uncharacterized protein n=1 Tax=Acrobeloides nanus TaxID=290746 RepID=A0A914C678_9BILA
MLGTLSKESEACGERKLKQRNLLKLKKKEPDLSWKKLIHDDAFESRMAKNLDETDMDLENDDEIYDETEIMPLDLVSVLDFEDEENENEYSIEL